MMQKQSSKSKKTSEIIGIITKVIKETPDTHTVRISLENFKDQGEVFSFKPGQFVMVRPKIDGKVIPRAYSISSSPTKAQSKDNYIDLTVRQTKEPTVSKWLNERSINDKIIFRGPYGQFFWEENHPESSQLLLIGGGSGITPLKSIIEYISDKNLPNKTKLLYSAKTQKDIILHDSLTKINNSNENIEIEFSLTREPEESNWTGRRGRIDSEYIKKTLKEIGFYDKDTLTEDFDITVKLYDN